MTTHYWSPATGGFYLSSIHGADIPADAVEITEAAHADLLAAVNTDRRARVALVDGAPAIVVDLPTLVEVKAAAIASLRAACAAAITGGFESAALGAVHLYPSKETDQINLMGSATASLLPGLAEGWVTPFWCADGAGEWAYRDHSATQIQTVGSDGRAHVVDCQTRLALLTSDVEAASDAAAVAAISWG